MSAFTNYNPQTGGGYGQSGVVYASPQPGFGLQGGTGPYVPPSAGRRGGSKNDNGVWGISFVAVCGVQLLLCLVLHLFLRALPGGYTTGLNSFGTMFNVILLTVSVLGIVAGIQRTRPLLNMHFMVAMLGLVMGLSMLTSTSKDVNLGCNILMMEMNLHVAEKAVMKMGNQVMLDSVSARMRELDAHMDEIEESSHNQHLAKEDEKNLLRDDYFILHSKIDALQRHAKTVQEQVMHMTSMLRHKAEAPDIARRAKAKLAARHAEAVEKAEEEGKPPPRKPDLEAHAEQAVEDARDELLISVDLEDPHDLADDHEDGDLELSPTMKRHLDRLKELFNKADEALEETRHPTMTDKDGEIQAGMEMTAQEYKTILADLTAAAQEIVAMEYDLGKELGGTKVHEIGKGTHKKPFSSSLYDDDYHIDDYLSFHDYDYDYDHDYRTQHKRPQAAARIYESPAAHEMLKELNKESDEVAERINRYKNKDYKVSNKHQAQIEEKRHLRQRRRSQAQAVFDREFDKSLDTHENLMQQWDRGSATCNKATEVVPQLMAVCFFILLAQLTSTYLSLSLIFRIPTKRSH